MHLILHSSFSIGFALFPQVYISQEEGNNPSIVIMDAATAVGEERRHGGGEDWMRDGNKGEQQRATEVGDGKVINQHSAESQIIKERLNMHWQPTESWKGCGQNRKHKSFSCGMERAELNLRVVWLFPLLTHACLDSHYYCWGKFTSRPTLKTHQPQWE